GGTLCAQLGDLAVKSVELNAELLGFLFTPSIIFKAGQARDLGHQRFLFSAGMLLAPALAHPADVAFFLGPVPRRIPDQLGGGQYLGDNLVDRHPALQQRSGDLHLCLVDRGVARAAMAHLGKSRCDVNRSSTVPGIGSKRLAGAIALLWALREQWSGLDQ